METISLREWAELRGINHFTARRYVAEERVQPAPQFIDNAWRFSPEAVTVRLPTDKPHRLTK